MGGLEMKRLLLYLIAIAAALLIWPVLLQGKNGKSDAHPDFRTSDRCVACHNGLKTSSGEDISIGFQWRASIMANSARDPYWQGSVRRESIDHPESSAALQDECSTCHMPMTHLAAKAEGREAEVFANLPLGAAHKGNSFAADGVSCSVCHQVEKTGLGTRDSFNGNVVIANLKDPEARPEYGPFPVDAGHRRVMQSSTGGFMPTESEHIRDSAMCGTCHTLFTKALGPGGKEIGSLPEQMPYPEWLHSGYRDKQSCQSCHMPEVQEPVRITVVYGPLRAGMHRHDFVGANFLMEHILNDHRDELAVKALPQELAHAADSITDFLETKTARLSILSLKTTSDGMAFAVKVENLTGHKFPTAYPSRRAWLHVVVTGRNGRTVFESGALNPDGSIAGNDNDTDPACFEPHYSEITNPHQVEIFEPILKDTQGKVTTGLLSAVGYLKDNRILPTGFDKKTAEPEIAVTGEAASDPNFTDKGSLTRYRIQTGDALGPFHVEAELWYQPIGFRWAHNLESYKAAEPQRFVHYYESAARHSAIRIVKAEATR
jgi:hypothetical protein